MFRNNWCDVAHTAVTYFYSVLMKDLMEFVCFREVLFYQVKEYLTNIRFDICRIRRIILYYFALLLFIIIFFFLYFKFTCAFVVYCHFFSILHICKDSQFNNTKIKSSKIQVQNKTQTIRKSYTEIFFSKACTGGKHTNKQKKYMHI